MAELQVLAFVTHVPGPKRYLRLSSRAQRFPRDLALPLIPQIPLAVWRFGGSPSAFWPMRSGLSARHLAGASHGSAAARRQQSRPWLRDASVRRAITSRRVRGRGLRCRDRARPRPWLFACVALVERRGGNPQKALSTLTSPRYRAPADRPCRCRSGSSGAAVDCTPSARSSLACGTAGRASGCRCGARSGSSWCTA